MQYDAIIIGGSFAGLATAIYIARARRTVCIIDTGLPRNRFAEHSHGFFAQDGKAPGEMLAIAREQVAAYPTVSFKSDAAISASKAGDGFEVTLASGEVLGAKRLVLAYGISDELPELPGLAERWGSTAIHCPYCHGYEFSGQKLGVLSLSPMSVHQAQLIPEWGPTTFFLNGQDAPDETIMAQLRARGVVIEPDRVVALHGEGKALSGVELENGRIVETAALYVGPRNRLNSDIAQQLGCEIEEGPLGAIIRTDAMKQTTVLNVFAAGDVTRAAHNVTWAVSDGVMAGSALHRSLVF
ncbi:NAD(P)/FAD-dependent oxidoreductase [Paradevosia shaoguanensis]|uniref:NAD(P)/FAD-dependent oxidoreductase n=1 Tax=Paradevosia shaoguanensis TaxID=1335043 RepID=UPI0019328561|nr:NAD(P)/FAD-dependent oxidoreductase [Paradevosia shaoguanensis]